MKDKVWNRRGKSWDGKVCSWAHTLWKTENRMTTTQKNTKHWEIENTSWKQNKRHQTSTKNKKQKKKQKKYKEGKKKTYIQNKKQRKKNHYYYKNKVFLNTTNNKENYNTNIWNNTKPIIYHTLPNKIKKIITSTYNYHNKQTLPFRDNINPRPQNPAKYRLSTNMTNKKITITWETTRQKEKTTPKKTSTLLNTRRRIPIYTFHEKKSTLTYGDIERILGPKLTLLLNHQEKHIVYFYKNTIQIKIVYKHISVLFKPYLNHTKINNTNPHLSQFCRNYQHCPHSHLLYEILITIAPISTYYMKY
jgi:hypothetical protein